MANYFFNRARSRSVAPRREAADDPFLFAQGPASGLGKIQFHDWRPVCTMRLPTCPTWPWFTEQAEALRALLTTAHPDMTSRRTWASC